MRSEHSYIDACHADESAATMRSEDVLKELVEPISGTRYVLRKRHAIMQTCGRRFSVSFDDSMNELAPHLGGLAARILLILPKRLDWKTWKLLPQQEIANHMGLSQSAICRALQELERHRLIERRGAGPTTHWRMTRLSGYRGRASQYHADERESFPRSIIRKQSAQACHHASV